MSRPHTDQWTGRLLVVVAVDAERDAVLTGWPTAHVTVGGVGPAAAAASTARALATGRYDVVLSTGIAGGFPPAGIGTLVVASRVTFADLGAETPDGFASVVDLGLGTDIAGPDTDATTEIARLTGAHIGAVLTVATVTGSAATAAARRTRHPDALAEAMEGAGVAAAAAAWGLPYAELRAISNLVGPRDRAGWRIDEALATLSHGFAAIGAGWSAR